MGAFDWPEYSFVNGKLCLLERGGDFVVKFQEAPTFASHSDAEAWLASRDIRGSVLPPQQDARLRQYG